MGDVLTMDVVRRTAEALRRANVLTHKVKDEAEAKWMTENDLFGKIWHVGEEYHYYLMGPAPR